MRLVIVDNFYVALFSALKHSLRLHVICDGFENHWEMTVTTKACYVNAVLCDFTVQI